MRLYSVRYLEYNRYLKTFSQELRNDLTYAEVLLWLELRHRKFYGYRFNRQKPIGKYIADFYCSKLRLVIEIDGYTHFEKEQIYIDKTKDEYYHSVGLSVIRLYDGNVRKNVLYALEEIEKYIKEFENKKK